MKWSRGFTLVELLVSISIVTVMMGVGLPAFRNYGRKAELNQAATDIQVAILQAHNLALAPESDKPSAVDYYGVQFNPDNSFDLIRGVRKLDGCPDPEIISTPLSQPPAQLEHHQLPTGISFNKKPDCVGYLVGTGGSPVIDSQNHLITLESNKIPDSSRSQDIQINSVTGQVSIVQTVSR